MEIIEMGNTCVCARLEGSFPAGREALFSLAERIFEECGRRLFENPEITAYSNGQVSLVFISRRVRRNAANHLLHNFVI